MMPWMLILHCMFALFAFSADTFFASDYIADIGGNDVEVTIKLAGLWRGVTIDFRMKNVYESRLRFDRFPGKA